MWARLPHVAYIFLCDVIEPQKRVNSNFTGHYHAIWPNNGQKYVTPHTATSSSTDSAGYQQSNSFHTLFFNKNTEKYSLM